MKPRHTTESLVTEYTVPSMACAGCAEKIGTVPSGISGVTAVKTKLWRQRVQVRFDPKKRRVALRGQRGAATLPTDRGSTLL